MDNYQSCRLPKLTILNFQRTAVHSDGAPLPSLQSSVHDDFRQAAGRRAPQPLLKPLAGRRLPLGFAAGHVRRPRVAYDWCGRVAMPPVRACGCGAPPDLQPLLRGAGRRLAGRPVVRWWPPPSPSGSLVGAGCCSVSSGRGADASMPVAQKLGWNSANGPPGRRLVVVNFCFAFSEGRLKPV